MHIRPFLASDLPAAAALLRRAALAFILHESTPDEGRAFLAEHDEDGLRGRLAGDYRYHAAVDDDGSLAGFIGIRARGHVFHLFVDAGRQRRGIARRLWEAGRDAATESAPAPALDPAADANADPAPDGGPPAHQGFFTVNSSNHAVPFYAALGFVRTAPTQIAQVRYNPMRLDLASSAGPSAAGFLAAPQP